MPAYLRHRKALKDIKKPKSEKELLQSMWETRIREAEDKKDEWKKEFKVDELEQAYYGNQKPLYWGNKAWFTLNLIFSSVKILKRNICPRNLEAIMRLSRTYFADLDAIPALEQNIKLREAILNYFIKSNKLWREGQIAYLNSLWQFGVLKTGYVADLRENEKAGGVMKDRDGQIIRNDDGMPRYEPEYKIDAEDFYIDQVDPDCFGVDRYCENSIEKTGSFVYQKIFTNVTDVKANPEYDKAVRESIGASALEDYERLRLSRDKRYMGRMGYDSGTELPENEIVILYEIYDLLEEKVLTLGRGADGLLQKPKDLPDGVDKHPFTILKFNERRSEFYPVPVIYNWLGAQKEYCLTRNQIAQQRKRLNRKYMYIEGLIDPDEVDKIVDGDDGAVAKAKAAGAFDVIPDAPTGNALYFDTTALRNEFNELTNVGDLQRNQIGAESATEAEIVENRSREGEVDDHEEMMSFLSETVKKLHNMVEANVTNEGAINIIGPAGNQWVQFGPEHFSKIAGEVVFEVRTEEATRMTLQVERAQLLQLLEIIGRNPMLTLSPVLFRAVASKFPALANNEELIMSLQQLGMLYLGIQQQQMQAKQGNQNQTKAIGQKTAGSEASKARNVAAR